MDRTQRSLCLITAILAFAFFKMFDLVGPVPAKAGDVPLARLTTQTKVTIAVTNTFISIAKLNQNRVGCTIQNNGTHTMFVFLDSTGGATPPSDTTTSFQLAAAASFNCNIGGGAVAGDEIWLTGTGADVAVLALQ